MKVLILHQHFNTPESGGPLRSYYLAKALLENGIQVAVITAGNHPRYIRDSYEGIEVHYLPIAYENRFGFYKRGLSFVRFAIDAVKIARNIKDLSLCYAISVPLTVGQSAIWIERLLGTPFYFEVGDLWPEAPIQLGFIRNPFLKQSLLWLEKRIYKKAKHIIALSEPIKNAIEKKTLNRSISVIPNMADTMFYQKEPKRRDLEEKYNVAKYFVVSYIGAVGFANGLDYLLECARASLKNDLPIRFLICGDGAMTDHLYSVKKSLKLDNLSILPFKERDGVKEVMSVTDAAFISYRPFPILETGSPNKYFDGLAAGKLIIINFKGWMKDEIETERCGIALDSKFPHQFTEKIKPFLENSDLLESYRNNARKLAEQKYSREHLSQKFVSLFKNV